MWVEKRAEAQADRDHAAQAGQDTAELDELLGDLDAELARCGLRGKADPDRPQRRHRSTRRRQDTPDLPRRKISPRTVGKTYTAPDGKTFRPSMFVTLTCPSYGRVGEDGTPANPSSYDYVRAARDALHFAALFDRFIQNLRRYVGHDVQYFAAIEPQRRLAPHVHIAMRGTIARTELRQVIAATYHQVWWPRPTQVRFDGDQLPVWHEPSGRYLDPATGELLPSWMTPWTPSPTTTSRCTWPASDPGSTPRASSPGQDSARCIGYLTKYLTKHVADCHHAETDAQAQHVDRLADALRYEPCSPTCANWLRYGIEPKNAQAGPAARVLQGQGAPPRIPRLRRSPCPGLSQVVGQDSG